jgi:hypothetical protein
MFNKGQFTHICQLNVSYGQDSVSGIVTQKEIAQELGQYRFNLK